MDERTRWLVITDPPEDLHRALFYREALGLPALDTIGHLQIAPPELPRPVHSESDLVGYWFRWFTELHVDRGTAEHSALTAALHPPLPPNGPLREVAIDHEADFQRWWASSPITTTAGQKAALATELHTPPTPERDLLAEGGHAVRLTVEVLGLSGPFTRGIHRDHVVVSQASRRRQDYRDWLNGIVFEGTTL